MRLGMAGIHVESSTFSPLPTEYGDFTATRGPGMRTRYPFLANPDFSEIEPVPLAHFRALPGGRVRREAYDAMKGEILDRLAAAGSLDAFYLDVHGAMAVAGLDDAEADLLAALRGHLPRGLPVTCSQDLHGNLSPAFVADVDLITAYRTAPHVDVLETRERAVRLLLRWHREKGPLHRAWVGIPVLVSGEMSSTENEPGRSLYAPLGAESLQPGVWDASLWIGYAWADQPRTRATATACGSDPAAVRATVESIARRVWAARGDFRFGSPAAPVEDCLEEAVELGGPGVFLSDAGDNPTAGAAGDVPATLAAVLAHPSFSTHGEKTAIFASMPDPAAVQECLRAGTGAEVRVRVGGKLDPVHGVPLALSGIVERLEPSGSDPVAGAQAVVRVGGVRVILTSRRKPFHKRTDFLALGLDPLLHTITVVKIGYLEPELKAMARHHRLVLSPGAVNPLLTALPFARLERPLYPLDSGFDWLPRARSWTSPGWLG